METINQLLKLITLVVKSFFNEYKSRKVTVFSLECSQHEIISDATGANEFLLPDRTDTTLVHLDFLLPLVNFLWILVVGNVDHAKIVCLM